jgi:hypothetical protein
VQVLGDRAGLPSSGGIGDASSPAPPIERDDAIASRREGLGLRLPIFASAVFAWSRINTSPSPPVSVYQSRTPGSSAYAPAAAAFALNTARHDPTHHHTALISERLTRRIDVAFIPLDIGPRMNPV